MTHNFIWVFRGTVNIPTPSANYGDPCWFVILSSNEPLEFTDQQELSEWLGRSDLTPVYRQPQYEHDCSDGCRFLGHVNGYDHYVHDDTLIARRSSDGPDYVSGNRKYPIHRDSVLSITRQLLNS